LDRDELVLWTIFAWVGVAGYLIWMLSILGAAFTRLQGFLYALTHPRMVIEVARSDRDELPVVEGTARRGKPYQAAEEAAGGIEAFKQLRS
jgi:hypothetical protein